MSTGLGGFELEVCPFIALVFFYILWTYCQNMWTYSQNMWTYCQNMWTYCHTSVTVRPQRRKNNWWTYSPNLVDEQSKKVGELTMGEVSWTKCHGTHTRSVKAILWPCGMGRLQNIISKFCLITMNYDL